MTDTGIWRGGWALAWLKALRLRFYPLSFLAYWLGAAAWLAVAPGAGLALTDFLLGYLAVFLLEAATVFTNDVFDEETDRRNRQHGPFSGGSRVLQSGAISRTSLLRAAIGALVAAVAVLAWLAARSGQPLTLILLFAGFGVVALGYTVPPLAFCRRGLGEAVVALTHSFAAIYAGWLVQGGGFGDLLPVMLSLPLFLAVFAAMLLAAIPDIAADRAAGKRTLAVRWGARAVSWLAALVCAGAAVLAIALANLGWPAWTGSVYILPVHAGLLAVLLVRRGTRAGRIDAVLWAALTYILWFVAIPLVNLT